MAEALPEELVEEEKSHTGIIPPRRSREEVVQMIQEDPSRNQLGSSVNTNFYVSYTLFSKLERTEICLLPVNVRAVNRYLLLVSLESIASRHTTIVAVEDHTHAYSICYLCNNSCFDLKQQIVNRFPRGTVFIVKEPCMRMCETREFVISVESPSDVITVSRTHELFMEVIQLGWIDCTNDPQSASGWKKRGNAYFGQGRYSEAIEAYNAGLENCSDSETELTLHLNLAAAYLTTRFFESCLEHCKEVLSVQPNNLKALWRSGRALYELRLYEDAKEPLEKINIASPSDKKVASELQRCRDRLKEQKGEINIYNLYQCAETQPFLPIELGDFMGKVEVLPTAQGHYRIIAKENFKPGTLIMTEKAFAAEFVHSPDAPLNGKTIDTGELFTQAVRAVFQNPKTFGAVMNLPTKEHEQDENLRQFCDEENQTEPIVDISKIRAILKRNTFLYRFKRSQFRNKFLFITEPHLRSSCFGNSVLVSWNDIIVVRALTSIDKGEEIIISGIDTIEPNTEPTRYRGNICTCAFCQLEAKDSKEVREQRVRLMEEFNNLIFFNHQMMMDLFRIITELKATYQGRDKYRVALFHPYLRRADALIRLKEGNEREFLKRVNKALNCLGLSVEDLLRAAEDENVSLPKDALLYEAHLVEVCNVLGQFPSSMHQRDRYLQVFRLLDRLFSGGVASIRLENETPISPSIYDWYPYLVNTTLDTIPYP